LIASTRLFASIKLHLACRFSRVPSSLRRGAQSRQVQASLELACKKLCGKTVTQCGKLRSNHAKNYPISLEK